MYYNIIASFVFIICSIHLCFCEIPLSRKYSTLSKYEKAKLSFSKEIINKKENHEFIPGTLAEPFSIPTIRFENLTYPSALLPNGSSVIFHMYTNHSGFLNVMWTNDKSVDDFITTFPYQDSVHCIFLNNETNGLAQAHWMQIRMLQRLLRLKWPKKNQTEFISKLHFVTTPVHALNNWIAKIFPDWTCDGSGCGFDVVKVTSECLRPTVQQLKRVDARYDWIFNHTWKPEIAQIALVKNECDPTYYHKFKVNLLTSDFTNCTLANKLHFASTIGAVACLVQSKPGEPLQDLNCDGPDCNLRIDIPVTSVEFQGDINQCLQRNKIVWASLKNIKSANFYFGIDYKNYLVEAGWFLYPSLQFLSWQSQWLVYTHRLNSTIDKISSKVVPIFDKDIMKGKNGTGVATVKLTNLTMFESIYLDMSLSCEESFDSSCPPWDHTVSLYVCCENNPHCGNEIGRWITPFRRGVGHWITDITMISPLLASGYFQETAICNFTMKVDAWWAMPWVSNLNLVLSKTEKRGVKQFGPTDSTPLFQGGVFDKDYNKKYVPFNFTTVLNQTYEVYIYAVITGHGSDDQNCAEFCVTSHHFVVNGKHKYVKTFQNAGTPLGCADRVTDGVIPNEHGTWLYGRDGWCDGQEVKPWIINISSNVQSGQQNSIEYYAYYNGKDPNPKSNPGEIIMSSYLVYVGY